jgi:hypothetical protein
LTYHVVAGKLSSKDILNAIKMGKGNAAFKTVNRQYIYAMKKGKDILLLIPMDQWPKLPLQRATNPMELSM